MPILVAYLICAGNRGIWAAEHRAQQQRRKRRGGRCSIRWGYLKLKELEGDKRLKGLIYVVVKDEVVSAFWRYACYSFFKPGFICLSFSLLCDQRDWIKQTTWRSHCLLTPWIGDPDKYSPWANLTSPKGLLYDSKHFSEWNHYRIVLFASISFSA